MVNSNHHYYRLFILGAGFSQPAGLPLGIELLEKVRNQLGPMGSLERDIQDWKRIYPKEELDLERVLAFSHRKHYLGLEGFDVTFAHGSKTIAFAREAIQQILIRETPVDTPALYRNFAKELTPYDTVLTFNYDTLLEQALDDIGKPYTFTPEWWLKNADTEQKYVDILKVHGSVDWYDRDYYELRRTWDREGGTSFSEKDPIFGSEANVPCEGLAKGPVEKPYGRQILSRAYRVLRHKDYYPLQDYQVVPFILPLAHDKLLGYSPIVDLWHSFHQAMWEVTNIVLIGYSMPAHDTYAYEAISDLLGKYQLAESETRLHQVRRPVQVITLADSKECALRNMQFLNPQKTRVWCQGFSESSLEWMDWGGG